MKRLFILCSIILLAKNLSVQNFISDKNENGNFPIVSQTATAICTDENDDWLIQKSASLFQNDIEKVSEKKPEIIHAIPSATTNVIIIGSIKNSKLIQQLIQSKKINGKRIRFKL